MPKLIFDIETVGFDFDGLDKVSQEVLCSWIKKETGDLAEQKRLLSDLKQGLGFSPLTGEIVCLGVYDCEKDQGVVYFQSPGQKTKDFASEASTESKDNFKFKSMTEKEMLENFWSGVNNYDEFITFNGRTFDVPFILIRSAKHKIRASKDLMSNRYLSLQKLGAKHVDLLDQLTFYGAFPRKGNLHLWCKVFGIKSPKAKGIKGEDIAELFKNKEYQKIAEYNTWDLTATKELYNFWKNYLSF